MIVKFQEIEFTYHVVFLFYFFWNQADLEMS